MKLHKTIYYINYQEDFNCILTVDKVKLKSCLQFYYGHQNSTISYIKRKDANNN